MNKVPAAQAIDLLIHEYSTLVFHTIYAMTGDWEESQDLTQDTFHQALRSIDAAREASGAHFHARAWLLRIAVNTVLMQRRRRNLFRFIPFSGMQDKARKDVQETDHEAIFEQAAPVQPGGFGSNATADPAEFIAERDAVRRTITRLPETLRVCLLLSVVGGLSNAEIADLLGLKEAAVRQRLVRARKQFQQLYALESGEELYDHSSAAASRQNTLTQSEDRESTGQAEARDPSRRLHLATGSQLPWSSYA